MPTSQLAATSAALRILLSGCPLAKPDNVQIVASLGFPATELAQFVGLAREGRNTILLIFEEQDGEAVFRQIIVVDGTSDTQQIYVGTCLPILKADGTFALLSQNEDPQEICFVDKGTVLSRKAATVENQERLQERGLRALERKAESKEAMSEGFSIVN